MGQMTYRPFGTSGLAVSRLVLGAMTFGEVGGVGAPLDECRRIIDAFADAGGNMIDTAINYRDGASETMVGELLEGRRERFVLSTKFGVSRDRSDPNASGSHRKNLRLSLETSLRRLRTDYLDVYWIHIHDRYTPIDETMRALDDAVRSGKVLHIGVSDTPAWIVSRAMTVAELRGTAPFVALQVPYSLAQRDIERELLPMAEGYGLAVTAWSPLAGGLLSGKYTGGSAAAPGSRLASSEFSAREIAVAEEVQRVADEIGATPPQVAIAWTMARSPFVHPMIGARTVDQLRGNLGALDVTLADEHITSLEAATAFERGFPDDFITGTGDWVFGARNGQVDGTRKAFV